MTANPMPPIPSMGQMTGAAPLHGSGKYKPVDPMRLLRQHWVLLIAATIAGGVLGVGAYIGMKKTNPKWTSEAALEASFRNQYDPVGLPVAQNATELEQFILGQIRVLKSNGILSRTLARDNVQATDWYQRLSQETPSPELQADKFAGMLGAGPVRGSAMIRLSLSANNPLEAPEVLSALIDVYLADFEERSEALTGRDFQQLNATKTTLTTHTDLLETDLKERSRNTPNSIQETPQWVERNQLIQLRSLKAEQVQAAQDSYNAIEQQRREGTLMPTANDMLIVQNDQRVRVLDFEIDRITRLLESNRARYGANHTVTKTTENDLEATRQQRTAIFDETMRQVLESNIRNAKLANDSLIEQQSKLDEQIEALTTALADLEANIIQRRSLADQISRNRDKLNEIDQSLGMLKTAADRSALANKTVIQLVPPQKSELTSPKLVLVPLGTLLGFGVPFGLLLLRDLLDQRVRGPQDLKAIPQAQILGVIPDGSEDPSGNQSIERAVQRSPTGLLAESFRQTRSALLGKLDRRGYKTVVVCGGQGGAGSSAVTQNLAASIALNGRKTLVIDTNFRRPRQHELFGVGNSPGLVEYLSGTSTDIEPLVQAIEGTSLWVLASGATDTAAPELLERPAFRELLDRLEQQFDLILIDTAPALLTSEASLLIKCTDAVLAVVRADSDHRGMVERLLGRLDGQHADLVGVVLNGVKASAGGYFKKNYEDFYRYNQPAKA